MEYQDFSKKKTCLNTGLGECCSMVARYGVLPVRTWGDPGVDVSDLALAEPLPFFESATTV